MKKYDIVKLTKLDDKLLNLNLYLNTNGIVLESDNVSSKVLFLNDEILGDYAVVTVNNDFLEKENFVLTNEMLKICKEEEIRTKINNKKNRFNKLKFKENDTVQLVVDREEYAKYGIYKGDKGIVAIDYSIDNSILVDFFKLYEDENYCGECVSVRLQDLEKVK